MEQPIEQVDEIVWDETVETQPNPYLTDGDAVDTGEMDLEAPDDGDFEDPEPVDEEESE